MLLVSPSWTSTSVLPCRYRTVIPKAAAVSSTQAPVADGYKFILSKQPCFKQADYGCYRNLPQHGCTLSWLLSLLICVNQMLHNNLAEPAAYDAIDTARLQLAAHVRQPDPV